MTDRTKDEIIEKCEAEINSAQRALNKFKERFDKDPAYAMEWSDAAYEAAAFQDLYRRVKNGFTGEDSKLTPAELEKWAREELRHKARHVQRSTSVGSNLMCTYSIAAHQSLIDYLDGRMF